MRSLVRNVFWRMKGVQVYALVGKSGTGKSFRSALIMEKYNISHMIDDGLLIRKDKIIAGRSAKREDAYLAAVKTAIFADREHREEVVTALKKESVKNILLLGTSDKMIYRITQALDLPNPVRIIRIEEIATEDEIQTAMHHRKTHGRHVIPVPSIEVKQNYPKIMADSFKILFTGGLPLARRNKVFEKTVVRPAFSSKGTVSISEAALGQMVFHCVAEFAPELHVQKVSIRLEKSGYRLNVSLRVPFGTQLAGTIHQLHRYIVENLEKFTGIIIEELHIKVDTVMTNPKNSGNPR
ncbi:hypothetical protein [Spirochaeta africana]|uniref:Asp23/Gls24 family envelope stress response protein n=1 Tax=Spirochaeta africana (strain ATCC 700263 / DSM 8902 / Z-7692) TaxID=889378 RepID=H9UKM5_SPIAZ|nr:hypothetical protein [Spirochaeta africana]AFG38068.1 Protein of unknown function (DUF322) [Spirochaeta africana DSM 8902]